MIYSIERKMISLGGSFKIYDECDNVVMIVSTEKLAPLMLTVKDVDGRIVCTLRNKMSFLRRIIGEDANGNQIFDARQAFAITKKVKVKSFDESLPNLKIKGGFWGWKYRFVGNGQKFAVMKLRHTRLRDTMTLDIRDDDSAVCRNIVFMAVATLLIHKSKRYLD